ncbi:hypothetical protein V8E36_003302 [Tilletia maclaganii]
MSHGERRHLFEDRCQQLALRRRLGLFRSLHIRRTRMAKNTARELALLTDRYSITSIPDQFATEEQELADSGDSVVLPATFATVEESVYSIVERTAEERRRLVRRCVLGEVSSTHLADPQTGARLSAEDESDSESLQDEDDDEDDAPGTWLHLRAAGRLALGLLRYVAEIELLKTLKYDRPAPVALSADRDQERQEDNVTTQHRGAIAVRAFTDGLSRQAACDSDMARPLYERDVRAARDLGASRGSHGPPSMSILVSSLNHEEAIATRWIEEKIRQLNVRRYEHTSFSNTLRMAEALRDHWLGKAEKASVLLPLGGHKDDVDEADFVDADVAADPEFANQLRRLRLDDDAE